MILSGETSGRTLCRGSSEALPVGRTEGDGEAFAAACSRSCRNPVKGKLMRLLRLALAFRLHAVGGLNTPLRHGVLDTALSLSLRDDTDTMVTEWLYLDKTEHSRQLAPIVRRGARPGVGVRKSSNAGARP
jgi:hypothetical protein